MDFSLRFAARSDIGLGRYRNNQDSGYAGPHLLVVADGMGGAAGGDIASSTVIGELVGLDTEGPGPDAQRDLVEAVERANAAMHQRVDLDGDLEGMGSTVTALLRSGDRLVLAHVGDSRAYRWYQGQLDQITHDHTFVQRLIDAGEITPDEAERHPQRSVILRVVGHMSPDDVDTETFTPHIGERWLLCSDGLSRVVSDETIEQTLGAGTPVEEAADQLVQLALRAGGPDNITVIVADVVDPQGEPTPLSPQVVGSAADTRDRASTAHGTAAAKAARLGADPAAQPELDNESTDQEDTEAQRRPWLTRGLALLATLVILVAGSIALRQWINQQYFLGVDNGQVVIYRGLDGSLGPISVNDVYRRTGLKVSDLPPAYQKVERMPTGSLAAVNDQYAQLMNVSTLCNPTGSNTPATASATTSTAPAPTAPQADRTTPARSTPTSTATIRPSVGATASSTADATATATERPSDCPS